MTARSAAGSRPPRRISVSRPRPSRSGSSGGRPRGRSSSRPNTARPSTFRCSTTPSTSIPRRRSRFSLPLWALAAGLPLVLGAAGGIDVARFFTVFAIMLLAGKFAGEAFERLGQPAVMGELLAGILLGAGFLKVIPIGPDDPLASVFRLLAQVGVVVLLFEIGLETDLKAMMRVGTAATAVAVVGVAVPVGLGVLYWRSGWHGVEHTSADPLTTAIFVGAALTATSVGLPGRVRKDLQVLHILSETNQFASIKERIKPVADIFTPIFFLSIGAFVDPRVWNPFVPESHQTLAIGSTLLAIAVVGKFVSGWAVPWRRFNRPAVGVGMAPRGEVGLIFAQIGLTAGILSNRLFSAILFVVIATTLVTPPLLHWTLRLGATLDEDSVP